MTQISIAVMELDIQGLAKNIEKLCSIGLLYGDSTIQILEELKDIKSFVTQVHENTGKTTIDTTNYKGGHLSDYQKKTIAGLMESLEYK